jgi:acetylornithine deacetylase/succinyl-diaminopimelate desuccinylase-like protein
MLRCSIKQVIDEEDRTPLIFITVDATEDNKNKEYSYFVSAWINYYSTVLMYGHLDKQPPLTEEWKKPYSPYEPVIEDDKLYGRGASDDGTFLLL